MFQVAPGFCGTEDGMEMSVEQALHLKNALETYLVLFNEVAQRNGDAEPYEALRLMCAVWLKPDGVVLKVIDGRIDEALASAMKDRHVGYIVSVFPVAIS